MANVSCLVCAGDGYSYLQMALIDSERFWGFILQRVLYECSQENIAAGVGCGNTNHATTNHRWE